MAGATIQWQYVAIIGIALLLMLLVYLLLEKTFVGNILQATAQGSVYVLAGWNSGDCVYWIDLLFERSA